MPNRAYYTLCVWDAEQQKWFDEFGDYSHSDVQAEFDDNSAPGRHKRIIKHDGSLEGMIAAREALRAPK